GWSVGCRNHRPGEPARRKPCRRAGDYRTGACPCVRRSEPCRSCNTADGVAVCHSGRKRSSWPDPVGRRPGKQGFDSKSGSGRPSQAGSGIGRNNQLSSLEVIVGQRLPSFNAPETPPLSDFLAKWDSQKQDENSWLASAKELAKRDFDLSARNPNRK